MMPESHPLAAALRAGLLTVLAFAAGCSTTAQSPAGETPVPAAAAPRGESEALMAAQNALAAGDCRVASESYLAAARFSEDPATAMRAAQLALGCHNLDAARSAALRWRELQPFSGEAALTAALVAMKRYDIAEAREALTSWRDSGSSGSQDPLGFAQALAEETDATLLYRLFGEVLVGEDPNAEVLLAQARLAMAGQNMQVAMDAATRAAALDVRLIEAQTIVLRALSVLGEHNAALAGARELRPEQLQGNDAYLIPDLLTGAGRDTEAQAELVRLAAVPELASGAQRRLISMALRQGRLDEAEAVLKALAADRGSTALAVLYLAELAERRGDVAAAIESYAMLADTPLGLSARSAAARLMIAQGAKLQALQILDDYAAQNPDQALEAGLTRAHLLVEAGDLKGALEGLDALAGNFPDHPELDYTRATVLESGGRTRQAVAEFERALQRRPDDPQLLNALGYTLADNSQRLREAEVMIRKALAASPDNPALQDSLGWVLYRRGRANEALPILARAWQNSADAEIGTHYGEVLWKTGDQSQARYVWQQALNGEPDHTGVRAAMKRLTGED
ncbi:MAG TPA: tetratricopeptide repeat protein [Steroidobacteraceae bacterium]|nr:tetratricopeptide repeat protein [Steroidobacteraceae bacterium]